ncbi:MAG: hypothetical protein HOW73_26585 [Polyangiaceae bacterium]|nr:hypothetical protein [Polyangiaceae bacterium]
MKRGSIERGKLKVDARRAALKLKDHLLADPTSWLCEVVRAASLAGATFVDVRHDADDVFVRFDGAPWPVDLLDHAASEMHAGTDGRRIRRLATAALASLGHEPRAVTVFVREAVSGKVLASRIAVADLERAVQREAREGRPKDGLEVPSICLHAERALSMAVVARAFGFGEVPEISRLAGALSTRAVPLHINGEAAQPPAGVASLVSVGLELPLPIPGLDVSLELVGVWDRAPVVRFHENGLVLTEEPFEAVAGVNGGAAGIHLPLRVTAHAEDLPTNVSRSKVREDVVEAVVAASRRAFGSLVDEARRAISGALESGAADRAGSIVDALIAAASTAVPSASAAQANEPNEVLRPLLDLPLLVDACGRRRSVGELTRIRIDGRSIFLRTDPEPLSAEHQPLVRDVFQRTGGRAEERLFAHVAATPYAEIARDVAAGVERRRIALAAGPTRLELALRPEHVLVHDVEETPGSAYSRSPSANEASWEPPRPVSLHSTSPAPLGFRARIALSAPCEGAESTLRIRVDGHVLETIRTPWQPGAVAIDAVVEWEGTLVPAPAYDGVCRDAGFTRAMEVLAEAVFEGLYTRRQDVPEHRQGELRAIVVGALSVAERDGRAMSIPVWPRVGGEALNTTQVASAAKSHHGVRFVPPGMPGGDARRRDGAPVLVLSPSDVAALSGLLGPAVCFADYSAYLGRPRTTQAQLEAALAPYRTGVGSPIYQGLHGSSPYAISVSEDPMLVRMHRGDVVEVRRLPADAACAIAIDEDYLVPGAPYFGTGAPSPVPPPGVAQYPRRALLDALVEDRELARHAELCLATRRLVFRALAERKSSADIDTVLRSSPLFRLQERGVVRDVSADELAKLFPHGFLNCLREADPTDKRKTAIIADDLAAEALATFFPRRVRRDGKESKRNKPIDAPPSRPIAAPAAPEPPPDEAAAMRETAALVAALNHPVRLELPAGSAELTTTVASLGMKDIHGFIGVVSQGPSKVEVFRPTGEPWGLSPLDTAAFPLAVHARVIVDVVRSEEVVQLVQQTIGRYYAQVAKSIESAPAFVRGPLTEYVLFLAFASRPIDPALLDAKLFVVDDGTAASLADLRSSGTLPKGSVVLRDRAYRALRLPPFSAPELGSEMAGALAVSVADPDMKVALAPAGGGAVDVRYLGVSVGTIPRVLGRSVAGAIELRELAPDELESGRAAERTLRLCEARMASALVAAFETATRPVGSVVTSRFNDVVIAGARTVGWTYLSHREAALHLLVPDAELITKRSEETGEGTVHLGGKLLVTKVIGTKPSERIEALERYAMAEIRTFLAAMPKRYTAPPARPAPLPVPAPPRPAAPAPIEAPAPGVVETHDEDPEPARGLFDGMLSLFGVERSRPAADDHPIIERLVRVLAALPLSPTLDVALSTRGRALSYEPRTRRLVVNAEHPVIRAAVAQEDFDSLAAAVLSEVNREDHAVTDVEERRALLALLSRSAAGS